MIRDTNLNDLRRLEENARFPIEHLRKPMLVEKTFEDKKGIIGSVFVNRTLEVATIFENRSDRDKIVALKQIPELLYQILAPMGYRDIHAFVNDPRFADIMVQHLGFEYAVGRALVRRF